MTTPIVEYTPLVKIGEKAFAVKTCKEGSSYSSFELTISNSETAPHCRFAQPENLVVIDSVKSGTGRRAQSDFYGIVMEPILALLNVEHSVVKTKSRDTISEFARGIKPGEAHTVIFLSGDTSISEFINGLATEAVHGTKKADLCILPIPMGTGNAWASSLAHVSPAQSFSKYINGLLRSDYFPLYRAIFPDGYSIVFFIIFSLGFHANLLHACEDPALKEKGSERFQIAAQRILGTYDLSFQILVGGCSYTFSYFALINTPNLEVSYVPSPMSDPLKPELHILGYSSSLKTEELTQKIMQGYAMKAGDKPDLDQNVVYRPLTDSFDLYLNYSKDSPRYKFEVCCDGLLLNFLDRQAGTFSKKIRIEFLQHYSSFSLRVLH